MYVFETILKKIINFIQKNKTYNLSQGRNPEDEAYKDCDKHIYMPIDSTGEYLACHNCGKIIKK